MSLNFQATHFGCTWPWEMLVMLCDGRIVCGCADPYAKRVLGDARVSSVQDVWRGPTITALRADMNTGGSKFCGDCALKRPLALGEMPVVRSLDAGPLPGRMFIECTAACNISCHEACCAPETGITRTRQAGMLDFEVFRKVIDEVGPTLGRIDFFNYGEAFLHKRAVEMCEYIKQRYPHIYLYTSTNGGAFTEEQARRLVHSGIDEVTFSIDGARPESYVQYRQRGKFDVVIRNLRAMADEKRKAGRDLPCLNWRYILFKWNDSDEEMADARRMASEIGVDRLCWEVTDHPESAFSRRFVQGSADYERIRRETWDDSNLGNAIPGATPRAHRRRVDVAGPLAPAAQGEGGRGAGTSHESPQPVDAAVSGDRHVRPPARAPRRATLHRRRYPHQSRLRSGRSARRPAATRGRGHRHYAAGPARCRPLHAQVRLGLRGRGLVRALRLAHDRQAAGCQVS